MLRLRVTDSNAGPATVPGRPASAPGIKRGNPDQVLDAITFFDGIDCILR
jgi:hypothetical protein